MICIWCLHPSSFFGTFLESITCMLSVFFCLFFVLVRKWCYHAIKSNLSYYPPLFTCYSLSHHFFAYNRHTHIHCTYIHIHIIYIYIYTYTHTSTHTYHHDNQIISNFFIFISTKLFQFLLYIIYYIYQLKNSKWNTKHNFILNNIT